MNTEHCPSRNDFLDLMSGSLPPSRAEVVALHLDTCEFCRSTITNVETSRFSRHRPNPVLSTFEFEDEPALQAVLAEIRDITRLKSLLKPVTKPSPSLLPPVPRLRDYDLLTVIGTGGMGSVYLARHVKMDRLAAIKLLPRERTEDPAAVARFEREVRAVGKLDHPNIVRALDAGESDGLHFLVMEYVNGVDLSQLSRSQRQLAIADACEIIRQAAEGLHAAHRLGIVHRDIKPSNLMLTRTTEVSESSQCVVKILDLGLALLSESHGEFDANLSGSGQILGTLHYMAPEQGVDSHNVDVRADIYSLGATLFRLLTGTPPFPQEKYNTPIKLLMAVANADPPSAGTLRLLPQKLVDLVDSMVARDPDRRPATASEIAHRLAPFATGSCLGRLIDTADRKEDEPRSDTLAFARAEGVDTSAEYKRSFPIASHQTAGTATRTLRILGVLLVLAAAAIAASVDGLFGIFRTTPGTVTARSALTVDVETDNQTHSPNGLQLEGSPSDRFLANRLLASGCTVIVETESSIFRCQTPDSLPNVPVRMVGLILGDPSSDDQNVRVINDSLMMEIAEAGLPELRSLTVDWQAGITVAGWQAVFSAAPNLESVVVTAGRPLPGAWFPELARLSSLRSLSLSGTGAVRSLHDYIVGSADTTLPQVTRLSLEGTISGTVHEVLPHIHRLPGLTRLELPDDFISDTDLRQVSSLTQLEVLRIRRGNVSQAGINALARLRNLRLLEIGFGHPQTRSASDCRTLCDSLRSQLPRCEFRVPFGFAMTTLPSMNGDRFVQDRTWKTESSRRAAEWVLSFPGSEVFLEPFFPVTDAERLPDEPFEVQIVRLNCSNKQATDDDLQQLADLPGLRTLYIRHATTLTGVGLAHLRHSPLAILECDFPLTADGAEIMRQLFPDLRYLDVPQHEISDPVFQQIASLNNLESLCLYGGRYSPKGLALLNFRNLNQLNLSNSNIELGHLRALERFPRLDHLVVEDTSLSDEALLQLEK
ncbi:MAG: serine/threonine protein kinase, partial [Planctomycetaceae bacterium]|nr:serine/threonine protein kinase [Planctomycetaceae bacterium]